MKYIGKDDILLDIFKTHIKIASSSITRINIYYEDEVVVEVDIKLLYNNREVIRLKFSSLIEYSFFHNSDYIFYNVESFKLLKQGDSFFISFDPDESTLGISEDDQDYILCNSFEAFRLD